MKKQTQFDKNSLEEIIGHKFSNENLCRLACTHSSFNSGVVFSNNEKLEFFGDSVLNFVVTQFLVTHFANKTEGDLSKIRSKIVSTDTLASAVEMAGLQNFLVFGSSYKNGTISRKTHANLFEALVAAVYIDGNMEDATKFVLRFLKDSMLAVANSHNILDYRTALQELVQCEKEKDLQFQQISRDGPDHDPTFCFEVVWCGEVVGTGCGKSKSEAQAEAAKASYEVVSQKLKR